MLPDQSHKVVRQLVLIFPAPRGLALCRSMLAERRTGPALRDRQSLPDVRDVWLVFGDQWVAWGVAISLAAGATTASLIGLILPWLLSHAKVDPAFGSGPVATVLQEVLTVIVYFEVMVFVLGFRDAIQP